MSIEDREIYAELKDLEDFGCFLIPESWYKEFNIEKPKEETISEFMRSGYTAKCAYKYKNLPPIIHSVPQDNGRLAVVPEIFIPELSVTQRPFILAEGEPFPSILPGLRVLNLKDEEVQAESLDQKQIEQECEQLEQTLPLDPQQ